MSSAPLNTSDTAGAVRPEVELLLCCAREQLDAARAARIAELIATAPLDWPYLLQLAGRHGLQPLLYWHLNTVCAAAVPAAQLQRLRESFRRISAFNVLLTGELRRLLGRFEAQGIPAIPYKGPALAATVYGNIALRQFSDLDIIVPKGDVARAQEILRGEGYAPLPELTPVQRAVLLREQCNLPFTRDNKRLVVEVHWAVAARHFARPLDAEGFWARHEVGLLAGLPVKRLAPADLLLALCVHGSKHLWERLGWICDIAELVRHHRADLDWPALVAQARQTGCERMLLLGLWLARDLLGAELPAAVVAELAAAPAVAALAADVQRDLFAPSLVPSGLRGYFKFQFRARRRLRDKFRYVRFVLTPTEEDLVLLALPAPLSFIYYLVRPVRLALTGGPAHFH